MKITQTYSYMGKKKIFLAPNFSSYLYKYGALDKYFYGWHESHIKPRNGIFELIDVFPWSHYTINSIPTLMISQLFKYYIIRPYRFIIFLYVLIYYKKISLLDDGKIIKGRFWIGRNKD